METVGKAAFHILTKRIFDGTCTRAKDINPSVMMFRYESTGAGAGLRGLLFYFASRVSIHLASETRSAAVCGVRGVQVLKIREDAHIYFTNDGRISMAGVTTGNVEYIAESIFTVTG